jgi:hypothetical protein
MITAQDLLRIGKVGKLYADQKKQKTLLEKAQANLAEQQPNCNRKIASNFKRIRLARKDKDLKLELSICESQQLLFEKLAKAENKVDSCDIGYRLAFAEYAAATNEAFPVKERLAISLAKSMIDIDVKRRILDLLDKRRNMVIRDLPIFVGGDCALHLCLFAPPPELNVANLRAGYSGEVRVDFYLNSMMFQTVKIRSREFSEIHQMVVLNVGPHSPKESYFGKFIETP